MIPKIAKGGRSFKGAFDYYMHDKDGRTSDRVAWAQTENMLTEDPQLAWKVMAFTAQSQSRLKEASEQSRAGRKLENPVFSFSLSWHPEQNPDQAHMLETAHKALEMMGMSGHESVIVAHRDEPQKHVHVIVNRVHPITGLAADIRNSKRKFSDFAREYERENGKIYCPQREENFEKRQNGELSRYHDNVIAEAWNQSRDGQGFIDALAAKKYVLAQGRKRLVVIDPHGKSHNPVRHLEGVKSKDFQHRLKDLDLTKLPDADKVLQQMKSQPDQNDTSRLVFEKLAKLKIRAMREQQRQEVSELGDKYRQRYRASKRQLANHYNLPKQKRAVQELLKATKNPSWWKRLTGKAKREKQELHSAMRNYQSAYRRYLEGLDSVKQQRREEYTQLRERQQAERSELKVYLLAQRRAGNFTLRDDHGLIHTQAKKKQQRQEQSRRRSQNRKK